MQRFECMVEERSCNHEACKNPSVVTVARVFVATLVRSSAVARAMARMFPGRKPASATAMRYGLSFFVIPVCLFCAAACRYASEGSSSLQMPTNDAIVSDSRYVYDLGIVRAGSTSKYVFRLNNTSGRSVIFDRFHASCNCSALTFSNKQLQPGEPFDITMTFRAAQRAYDTTSTAQAFFSGGGDEPWTVRLALTARVRPDVALSSSELFWETYDMADLGEMAFLVRNYSNAKWSGISVVCSEPWLSVRIQPVGADQDALQTWQCIARPEPAQLCAGEHLAWITVLPEGPLAPVWLPVRISIQEPVILMPRRVFSIPDRQDGSQTVDLLFLFRTNSIPTSAEEFIIVSELGNAILPEVVRNDCGKWVLRCHITPEADAIREHFRVDIPSLQASIEVPVFVSSASAAGASWGGAR